MPEKKPNIIALMAEHYSLEPDEFVRTIKATCGLAKASAEEFLAFLLVAKEHDLNPLTREIYAFKKSEQQGGGIQIILSVDGWLKKMNSHPMHDGIETKEILGAGGELIAVICRIWRKDRKAPIVATEYLKECRRQSDPWRNMPSRMLTHRAKVQAIRTAYGLAGLMEEDEALAYLDRLKVQPTNVVDATETPLDKIADSIPEYNEGFEADHPDGLRGKLKAAEKLDRELVVEPEPVPEPEPVIEVEEPAIDEEQQQMLQSAVVMGGWPVKAIPEVVLVHAGCPLEQIKSGDFMKVMNAILEAGKKRKAKILAEKEQR